MKLVSPAVLVLALALFPVFAQAAQETPGAQSSATAKAPAPFTGPDYSGIYKCAGQDSHEGPYTGIVTLKLVRSQSHGEYGAYRFTLDGPDYDSYPGQAAA